MNRSYLRYIKNFFSDFSTAEVASYVILLSIALCSVGFINLEKNWSLQAAEDQYIERSQRKTSDLAQVLNSKFRQIYQGMRTIARLPGVRTIDRYAKGFDDDARKSAQEIYNNLAENVAVSELYIVPAEFDPDKLDQITGARQEPITTFDELIVGKTADEKLTKETNSNAKKHQEIDEIEIFEYRSMKRQLAVLKKNFANEAKIEELSYPAIAGEEVITCDNTRFSPSRPNDDDRKGIVYSVPFYGTDGALRGMVSAVILTVALRELLPGGQHAIHNAAHNFNAGSIDDGVWQSYLNKISTGTPALDLIYSEVVPLNIVDGNSNWFLWAGEDTKAFSTDAAVVAANEKATLRTLIVSILSLSLFLVSHALVSRQRLLRIRNEELESHVRERTEELSRARNEAEEANLSKTSFLANVSHEIRTPMNAIMGLTDLLLEEDPSPTQKRQLKIIQNSSDALLSIMNQLLDLAAIEQGRSKLNDRAVSVTGLVDEVVGLFKRQSDAKKLRLQSYVSENVPETVLVDGGRLRQVLINLISNAIKFTDAGEVNVSVRLDSPRNGDEVILWFDVSDTGKGIEASLAEGIFESFHGVDSLSTEYGSGAGLGLSICQRLVELMGGRIDYESVPGLGSMFSFTVKAHILNQDATIEAIADDSSEAHFPIPKNVFSGANILVVDDNPTMRDLMKEILAKLGCQITFARNGQEAIDFRFKTKFDAIFLDCRMPEVDGFTAAKCIREREKKAEMEPVSIIALTASAFSHDKEACLQSGMTDFLRKPASARQIYEVVSQYISEKEISSSVEKKYSTSISKSCPKTKY